MFAVLVTLEMSHSETSELKLSASWNTFEKRRDKHKKRKKYQREILAASLSDVGRRKKKKKKENF